MSTPMSKRRAAARRPVLLATGLVMVVGSLVLLTASVGWGIHRQRYVWRNRVPISAHWRNHDV
jgi:hypothetical protein